MHVLLCWTPLLDTHAAGQVSRRKVRKTHARKLETLALLQTKGCIRIAECTLVDRSIALCSEACRARVKCHVLHWGKPAGNTLPSR